MVNLVVFYSYGICDINKVGFYFYLIFVCIEEKLFFFGLCINEKFF